MGANALQHLVSSILGQASSRSSHENRISSCIALSEREHAAVPHCCCAIGSLFHLLYQELCPFCLRKEGKAHLLANGQGTAASSSRDIHEFDAG
jgi:hypothetical protein